GKLLRMVSDNTISGKIAKIVFEEMAKDGADAEAIVKTKGLLQITDRGEIEKIIDRMFELNQKQLQEYLGGKEAVFGHFVGQVMKLSQGRTNPAMTNEILKQKLAEKKQNQ
ncbi:MAG TPA: Asp-tRNA(Asn)/Glu-tRNA(Gln) amidotransferase GatCAB subunit B, partial [bacterium]|nr:Asp-tRNA(Asn)/Glu-tRNA(Gln) amidotransferase GatCAB subunit B [bacterium]